MLSAERASPPARRTISSTRSSGDLRLELLRAAADDDGQLLLGERLELVDLCAREQRRIDLEVGVLGRRADQRDEALLDGGQQRILLRLVEAVDLVEEQDRARRPSCRAARGRGRAPRARPSRSPTPRTAPRTPRRCSQRRCARASSCRSPADRRRSTSARGPRRSRAAGRLPCAEHVLLPDELVERPRSQALRERRELALPAAQRRPRRGRS